jgi:hypothetical protein
VQNVQLMKNLGMILILGLLASGVPAGPPVETTPERPLLRDGSILTDAAGTLIRQPAEPPDSNEVWLFELSSDVNDSGPARGTGFQPVESTTAMPAPSGSVLKAGMRLQLLPSSALERMVADVPRIRNLKFEIPDSPPLTAPAYLLSGRVTKYKGANFIFPNYFLPLLPEKPKTEIPDSNAPAPGGVMALDEPNDVLAMPPDIIEKLRARREKETSARDEPQRPVEDANAAKVVRYAQSPDSILADRTALLVQRSQGGLAFSLDALGRNIQHVALRLLPCEALELAEREQSAEPEPVRFRIAGIVTTYKGDSYLLLQKAIRTYSHGNFGR